MEYYAHKDNESGKSQLLCDHLENVAGLASSFAVDICKDIAKATGALHDIGKFSEAFQHRLDGGSEKFEHASCGAIELNKLPEKDSPAVRLMQYCIAGHHTGLPNGGSAADLAEHDTTLNSKLKRGDNYVGKSDYSAYKNSVQLSVPDGEEFKAELVKAFRYDKNAGIEAFSFFTRYVFSCLTDADYLDTEAFFDPDIKRGAICDFPAMSDMLDKRFLSFKSDTPLKAARDRLQAQAFENSAKSGNVHILNMPTGSGKTLCSMRIALNRLLSDPTKKRIIYVIPYMSIIEQTADLFEDIFKEKAEILQHHSNYCYDENETEEYTVNLKLKKAAENWDAQMIITTSVQFFQSLYHYKSSALRKMHNMADAVIVFDEIHMLPIELLQPCIRGIGFITKYLNSEAILLSATMPDHSRMFEEYAPDISTNELITDKSDFNVFKKCDFTYLGKTDLESIAERSSYFQSSLIVVNDRKSARELYNMLSGHKYHLSTYMTPVDRSNTIRAIRCDLEAGRKITVVSTSLIEAGVDLDFEAVFRQLAGLDNVIQSAGRCNREGKRKKADVFIFETESAMNRDIAVKAGITRDMLSNYEDITSPECIKEYYQRIFEYSKNEISDKTISNDVSNAACIPFRDFAEQFEFIKDDTVGVVIDAYDETKELLSKLGFGQRSVKRKLQKYTVALRRHGEFNKALEKGLLTEVNGVYILADTEYYNKETGLIINMNRDMIV